MIRKSTQRARSFLRKEDGSAMLVPAALWIPVFATVIVSGVEMGTVTARHTMLEQAMDRTVRDVRLGTGTVYTRESLKQSVCDYASVLPDCMATLQLEMIKLDIRDWMGPPVPPYQCQDMTIDQTGSGSGSDDDDDDDDDNEGGGDDEVVPVVAFEYGRENELMLLRACFKYEPLSPLVGLGKALEKDAAGYTQMVAEAAFVHEPL